MLTVVYLQCYTVLFPSLVTCKLENTVQEQFVHLQNSSCKAACQSSTPYSPHHSHHIHLDQIKDLVSQSIGSRSTQAKELFTVVLSLIQPPVFYLLNHFSFYLQETFPWLGFSPLDTSMPDGPLTLQNGYIDFAAQHWFSCSATEPRFTGDIGAI